MKVLVAVALLIMTMWGLPVDGEERARVLCGRKLADAHMLYCFNPDDESQQQQQKKAAYVTAAHKNPSMAQLKSSLSWALDLERPRALQLASRGKRDPGLVDECCYKACYISELLNYC